MGNKGNYDKLDFYDYTNEQLNEVQDLGNDENNYYIQPDREFIITKRHRDMDKLDYYEKRVFSKEEKGTIYGYFNNLDEFNENIEM